LCAAAISGCSDRSTDGATAPAVADPVVVRGEAMYVERIAPPPDAQLEISLINASLADSADAVVASLRIEGVGAPPMPFEMSIDPGKLDPRMSYSLRATLRDGSGRLHFTGDAHHPVVPGEAAPVVIRMKRVTEAGTASTHRSDAVGEAAAPTRSTTSRYRCGDRIVDAEIVDEAVILRYDDVERALPRGRSASGARYAQDGDEFWTRGDGAMLTLGGERADCTISTETTPWEDAAARDVSVRVVGNEPGWLAEIGTGARPSLRLVLDYGERELSFDATTPLDGAAGFRADHDGMVAELRLIEEACEDPMSGERHPLRATLAIDNRTYVGCGRRLVD